MRRATLDRPPVFALSTADGAHLRLESDTGAVAHVFVLEDDLMRLMVLPTGALNHPQSWTVAAGADDVPLEGRDRFDLTGFACPPFTLDSSQPGRLLIQTKRLRLSVALTNFACLWEVLQNGRWIEAVRDRPTQAYDFGWWGGAVRHYLARSPGEQYFGLGERSGPMDRAGRRLRLSNVDAMGYDALTSDPLYKHIPFYITRRPDSGLCFGLFYDTLSDCTFDFGCEHSNYHGPYRYFAAEHGDVDLYLVAGPTLPEVVRRFTWLTGRPAETPDWALAYSGSTMSYTDAPDAQARLQGFLDDLTRHDMPCGSFHLSSGYTSIGDRRYVFTWNRDKFPDPVTFVGSFAKAGIKLIANIKPVLLHDHPEFETAANAHLLLSDKDRAPVLEQFWDAPGAYLDFTRLETITWWKEKVTSALLDLGVAATWNDNNEYEVNDPSALAHGFGAPFPAQEMKPLQTMLMLRASRDAQREHAPDRPPFLISRSGAAGMQRYAQTWSGDNFTSWRSLKWNGPMGLGLALSGVSNFGHDIGGFAGPRPDAELFARWVAYGVFLPRFSIHSWNDDGSVNEPWMHPEITADIRALLQLRTRLTAYLGRLLRLYRQDYEPAVRPLFYDFPEQEGVWTEQQDAFMLGAGLLVAPVVEPGVATLSVRLPAGCDWRDGWTGEALEGTQTVSRPTPYDRPPFFLRSDVLTATPELQTLLQTQSAMERRV